jgi:hypothetical protein
MKKYLCAGKKNFFRGLVAILCMHLFSCNTTGIDQDACHQVALTSADLKEKQTARILLLIADDRSGSIVSGNQPRRMSEEQYRELLQSFCNKGYSGEVAVRVIGDPDHTGFEKPLLIHPGYSTHPIPANARLSDKSRLLCVNRRIADTCAVIGRKNKENISNYLEEVIRPRIINYRPSREDRTNLDAALRDIENKLNISADMGFDKIIVVVMSDGEDSDHSEHLAIVARTDFELVLIGWPRDRQVHNDHDRYFESGDGFINWFTNTKL